MKKFTCKEMGGPCDVAIEGNTMEEVVQKGGDHLMATADSDSEHQKIAEQMKNGTEEGKAQWFAWFKTVWDQKQES